MPRPQIRKPPKWSDLALIDPVLLLVVYGFVVWMSAMLYMQGMLHWGDTEQLKLAGIFLGVIVFGYVAARAGYMWMQKAATPTKRTIWRIVMIVGLFVLLATLTLQFWKAEYGFSTMLPWAVWMFFIASFEGRSDRTSMFMDAVLQKVERTFNVDLDGHPNVTLPMPDLSQDETDEDEPEEEYVPPTVLISDDDPLDMFRSPGMDGPVPIRTPVSSSSIHRRPPGVRH